MAAAGTVLPAEKVPAPYCRTIELDFAGDPALSRNGKRVKERRTDMNAVSILIMILLVVVIALAGYTAVHRMRKGNACCGTKSETVRRHFVSDRNKSHYPYLAEAQVTQMTCDNCAARVENALNQEEDIWASVRIDTKKALIRSKKPIDQNRIKSLIVQAGYGMGTIHIIR